MKASLGKAAPSLAVLILSVLSLSIISSPVGAASAAAAPRPYIEREPAGALRAGGLRSPVPPGAAQAAQRVSASVDTFLLVYYDFEQMYWQGWTRKDNTAAQGRFWHVEDFLEPCFAGRAAPLEGEKSFWCGTLPGSGEYMCSWASAPGYGNGWNQVLSGYYVKRCSPMTISFLLNADIEEGKDFLRLEAEMRYDGYEEVASFTGRVDSAVSVEVPGAYVTKLRFRFETDGSGSDQDGLYTSNCSVALDSIYITTLGGEWQRLDDFESYQDGDQYTYFWDADYKYPFGSYSCLYNNLIDRDPCSMNAATQIVFWCGSAWPDAEYPGLYSTPFCQFYDAESFCQDEMVISPPIDIRKYSSFGDYNQDAAIPAEQLSTLGGAQLRFTVYRDLPLENLVYYRWHVRSIQDGCPGPWVDRGLVYHGDKPEYFFAVEEIGDLLQGDTIQVALGVVDMCGDFFDTYGNCETHTPAPFFDNVSVVRYSRAGPQWHVDPLHLFQDNFPSASDLQSYVRADIALDINPPGDPDIRPGDSVVVSCGSPFGGGLAEDGGGARVYMHVRCRYISSDGLRTDLSGSVLEGSCGHYVSDDGTWTIFQADSARAGSGAPAPGLYSFDLNDSLLTRGFMVEYYFEAFDNGGLSSTMPDGAESMPEYPYPNGSYLYEFTCLPTQESLTLFVDGYDGIGCGEGLAQLYFESAFDATFAGDGMADRYDRLDPEQGVANSLASRAKLEHLLSTYSVIFWDCGDLASWTIPDGTSGFGNKSDDCGLLSGFLDNVDFSRPGVIIAGDNIATELDGLASGSALDLMNVWFGTSLAASSYYELSGGYGGGGVVYPLITGLGCVDGAGFYLMGGCPGLSDFDVLEKDEGASYICRYPDAGGGSRYAGIEKTTLNGMGWEAHAVWLGFSFMDIGSSGSTGVLERNVFIRDLLRQCMKGAVASEDITGDETPAASFLARNIPNPFNPSTAIRFGLKEDGRVTLRIYDVSGRMIATIVDEDRRAGYYTEVWNGFNDLGRRVASGVYFMRMESPGFSVTRKVVLLK